MRNQKSRREKEGCRRTRFNVLRLRGFRWLGRSWLALILARDRGEQRMVTEVTDKELGRVYHDRVLGCKMEIPVDIHGCLICAWL